MAKRENPAVVSTSFRVPSRNIYDQSHGVRFDTNMGFIVPVTSFDLNPAERLRATPQALVRTEPLLAPLMGRARCRLYAFWVPYYIYVPDMYTNGKIEETRLPQIRLDDPQATLVSFLNNTEYDEQTLGQALYDAERMFKVKPNTLLDYFNWPIGYTPFTEVPFADYDSERITEIRKSGIEMLATWDIFRNYFADRNQTSFPLLNAPVTSSGNVVVSNIPLERIDNFYEARAWYYRGIVQGQHIPAYWGLNFDSTNVFDLPTDSLLREQWTRMVSHFRALPPIKSYMPDINSAFASNTAYEQAIAASVVRLATVNGLEGITTQSLLDGERMHNFMNKLLATGGQLDEMVRAEFGVDVTADLDIPMFLKMWQFDLGFDTIFGTGSDNTGEMRGRGLGALSKAKALNFSAKHHGKVMIFMTIEPYQDYYQGFDPFVNKTELSDLFWPSFDRIGWQPLTRGQLDASSVGTSNESVEIDNGVGLMNGDLPFGSSIASNRLTGQIGVQPAYTEYKGKVNRLHGSFAGGDLAYWTFGRDYGNILGVTQEGSSSFTPFSTYINPYAFNASFVDVSQTANPYLCEVAFNATIKRVISRSQLENF